jgi:predicted amidohydrolase YtcJ
MDDMVLFNGQIWVGGDAPEESPLADTIVIADGRVKAVGSYLEASQLADPGAKHVDLGGRRVVPGLIDSHIHAVRAGFSYLDELDWAGVRDLDEALETVRVAAMVRPTGEWITALGGWHPTQFSQNRMPTKAELDEAAPNHPVFVHPLYGYDDFAVLNSAALVALGWVGQCPDPDGGVLFRDEDGAPDGRLAGLAAYQHINRQIIQPTPRRSIDSTQAFFDRLSSLGLTGIVDAGGLGMDPERYHAVRAVRARGTLPLRVRLNLCAVTPGNEASELGQWRHFLDPGFGDEWLSILGLGELIVVGCHDWEGMQPFEITDAAYKELVDVCLQGARTGWPHTIHAILDSSISRILDALEEVNRSIPIAPLRWNICHAEWLTDENVQRIAALGIGVAFQARLQHKAAICAERWGEDVVLNGPPLGSLMAAGIPIGAGTDSTRGASYNPWLALAWFVTGKPIDDGPHRALKHRMTRAAALNAYTRGSAWFSFEDDDRGHLSVGARADLAVLSDDYFAVDEDRIADITSELTICGGKIVHNSLAFDLTATHESAYPIFSNSRVDLAQE